MEFAQAKGYLPTCFTCGVKRHTVNDCPKLNDARRDKFWADRKAAQEAKRGVAHVVVADAAAATPAPAPAPSVTSVPGSNTSQEFKRFQRYMALMKAMEDLDVGFTQVGTLVEKKVSFASVQDKPGKRFMLNPHKLFLHSCTTYHSVFVRNMLSNVKTGDTVLQRNCNTRVSTSQEKEVNRLWTF